MSVFLVAAYPRSLAHTIPYVTTTIPCGTTAHRHHAWPLLTHTHRHTDTHTDTETHHALCHYRTPHSMLYVISAMPGTTIPYVTTALQNHTLCHYRTSHSKPYVSTAAPSPHVTTAQRHHTLCHYSSSHSRPNVSTGHREGSPIVSDAEHA
eukprot:543924-Rhodomonas_salina.1